MIYEVGLPLLQYVIDGRNSDGYRLRQDIWDWLKINAGEMQPQSEWRESHPIIILDPTALERSDDLWDFYVAPANDDSQNFIFQFKDPSVAALFKLTWK